MTFVLKELRELRKHFDDTVQIILKREHKGKIEDLTNPQRKFELQYLTSLLVKIEEQAKDKPRATIVNLVNVFYGAMLTVTQDIENNRGMMESSGLLDARLKDAIGISEEVKAEDRPDLYQIAKFHTTLNAFLNQVFIEHDSRKGFAKNHMLTVVPTESLSKLIQTSYKLENEAQKTIVTSLATDGQTAPELHRYRATKKSPASATDRFGGWDKLNSELDELIKDELADKNVSKIEKLKSKERAAQLHFLNAIRNTLKNSTIDEAERVAILAGSMHLVRQQILKEYDSSYISSSEKSIIFKGLNKILALDVVAEQDIESLVTSANQFVQYMTVAPKNNNKKAIRSNHIFSAIADFNLKATFNLFIDMIYACRMEALKAVVEEFKKETKGPEKAPKGYLGGLSSALSYFKAKKEDEDEEDDDEIEHKSTSVPTKN